MGKLKLLTNSTHLAWPGQKGQRWGKGGVLLGRGTANGKNRSGKLELMGPPPTCVQKYFRHGSEVVQNSTPDSIQQCKTLNQYTRSYCQNLRDPKYLRQGLDKPLANPPRYKPLFLPLMVRLKQPSRSPDKESEPHCKTTALGWNVSITLDITWVFLGGGQRSIP